MKLAAARFVTLHQPWGSLIALGAKWIETRDWATPYRGPLVIHAGAAIPSYLGLGRKGRLQLGEWEIEKDGPGASMLLRGPIGHPYRLPFAAAVAVVDLVDVIPMVTCGEEGAIRTLDIDNGSLWVVEPRVYPTQRPEDYDPWHAWLRATGAHRGQPAPHAWEAYCDAHGLAESPDQEEVSDQLPFGDFAPGRFAWLLDNVRPLTRPVPMRGDLGVKPVQQDVLVKINEQLAA